MDRPEGAKPTIRHVLFVEGRPESIDLNVVSRLLKGVGVMVCPMGPSPHVRSAAQSLRQERPNFYFLIDRDFRDLATVHRSWNRFSDPAASNLLIWPRRELENYFLNPKYLAQSPFLNCSTAELEARILMVAAKRIYLEAANMALVKLKSHLNMPYIDLFPRVNGFETRTRGLETLLGRREFHPQGNPGHRLVQDGLVKKHYEQELDALSGGNEALEFGRGDWLERVKGKKILPTVINECFSVPDGFGGRLSGQDARLAVVKELSLQPLDGQPADFRDLRRIIKNRVTDSRSRLRGRAG